MFIVNLKKDKEYKFCSCGVSKSLPFCDNEHRKINLTNKIKFKSIKIIPDKNVSIRIKSKKWVLNDE